MKQLCILLAKISYEKVQNKCGAQGRPLGGMKPGGCFFYYYLYVRGISSFAPRSCKADFIL